MGKNANVSTLFIQKHSLSTITTDPYQIMDEKITETISPREMYSTVLKKNVASPNDKTSLLCVNILSSPDFMSRDEQLLILVTAS
jgi:hypothetical protein